jgi:hypothetical protein
MRAPPLGERRPRGGARRRRRRDDPRVFPAAVADAIRPEMTPARPSVTEGPRRGRRANAAAPRLGDFREGVPRPRRRRQIDQESRAPGDRLTSQPPERSDGHRREVNADQAPTARPRSAGGYAAPGSRAVGRGRRADPLDGPRGDERPTLPAAAQAAEAGEGPTPEKTRAAAPAGLQARRRPGWQEGEAYAPIHWAPAPDAPRRLICGSDTLTTVPSTNAMLDPRTVAASTRSGR